MTEQRGSRAGKKPTSDVRCPSCGIRFSDPDCDGFEVVIPYKSASQNELAGFNDQGEILLGDGDVGVPTTFFQPELCCNGCGHQWKTSIPWGGWREQSQR